MKNVNPHRGSSFDDFLEKEDMYDEVNAGAVKKLLVWQISRALDETGISKTELAARMKTSRSAVNRLLDPENSSLNLQTMDKAARALGRRIDIQLVETN